MSKRIDNAYPFKVWALCHFLGAVWFAASTARNDHSVVKDFLDLFLLAIIFGVIFSFPALILYFVFYRFFIKITSMQIVVKLASALIPICFVPLTGKFMGGSMLDPTKSTSWSTLAGYVVAILVSSLVVKMRKPAIVENTSTTH